MAIVYEAEYSGKTKFGLAIESTIKSIIAKRSYSDITKDKDCDELSDIISKMTKGNVKVTIGAFNEVNAYAQIPLLDNNNPLITRSITDRNSGLDSSLDYQSFRRKYPDLIGGFDFKKNEFVGWAKEIKYELCLGYKCLYPDKNDKDMNPVIATFILCHEFGHLIEKVFGVGTLVRENYVLSQAHHRLMGETNQGKKIKIIRDIAKEEAIDPDELIDSVENESTLYTVTIDKLRGNIRSELDSYGYDQTGFESMADYYAAKQGYAVGALYLTKPRVHVLSPDDVHYLVSWALSGAFVGLMASSFPVFHTTMLFGLAYSALTGYSYDTGVARYDDAPHRLERTLNTYIESIKSKKAKVTNEELVEVKKMIRTLESMKKEDRGAVQSIYEYVNPRGRKNKNARELQKNLESLANHKLNIKVREYYG